MSNFSLLFAQFPFEADRHEHPWYKQLQRDLAVLCELDDLAWLGECASANPMLLLQDTACCDVFLSFDVSVVAKRHMGCCIPPPGFPMSAAHIFAIVSSDKDFTAQMWRTTH